MASKDAEEIIQFLEDWTTLSWPKFYKKYGFPLDRYYHVDVIDYLKRKYTTPNRTLDETTHKGDNR